MDGVHDLGGKQGFGPVVREENEPPFHEPWEGRVHGINLTSDHLLGPGFRYGIERMGAVAYLTTSYYEHWLATMEIRGLENGAFTRAELDAAATRIASGEPVPVRYDPAALAEVQAGLKPYRLEGHEGPEPRYAPGDRVSVVRRLAPGHTRCPGYLRGAPGMVERVHRARPLLDVYETDGGRVVPLPWYTVAFRSRDLWADAGPGHTVLVDLWESHLEHE